MAEVSVTVRKPEIGAWASVTLEVQESSESRARTDLYSPANVASKSGAPVTFPAVQAACYSGALYAFGLSRLDTVVIVLRAAEGVVEPEQVEGFAHAAAVAFARAVNMEHLLDPSIFNGWFEGAPLQADEDQ